MTFSILARCPRTGRIGAATTTSAVAVGSRVPYALPKGLGGVLTQHRTDPRLGPRGLRLLEEGCTAAETIAALVASTPHAHWRQLAVVDAKGDTAFYHGANVKPCKGVAQGPGVIAIGNILANDNVTAAILKGYLDAEGEDLATRLMAGLQAGEDAGGEHGDVHSAALLVMGEQSFPLVDLRVDYAEKDPIGQLTALWRRYEPTVEPYIQRVLDADNAPVL
ncbi:DUF1028 domain-containing protein [Acetobacteraceae bacterium H6797]|nr:DUF1028 domain-containing protein [Acetobacteraceae bacterium H6797]